MLLVVLSGDLIVLLVGWEVMGICSYLLIGHDRTLPEAPAAAVKAFLVTRFGDVGFLLGIALLGISDRHASGSTWCWRRLAAAVTGPHHHHRAAAARRGGRQERAVPAAHLAAGRDGRPDPDLRADPRRHHGRRRCDRAGPALAGLFQASSGLLAVIAVIAVITMLLGRLRGVRPGRHQAGTRLEHGQPGRRTCSRASPLGYPSTALFHLLTHAAFKALLFLAAGARDPRGRHQLDGYDGWPSPVPSGDVRDHVDRPGGAGRGTTILRVLLQGRDRRAGVGHGQGRAGRGAAPLGRPAPAGRVADHRGADRVVRRPGCGCVRSSAGTGAAAARTKPRR